SGPRPPWCVLAQSRCGGDSARVSEGEVESHVVQPWRGGAIRVTVARIPPGCAESGEERRDDVDPVVAGLGSAGGVQGEADIGAEADVALVEDLETEAGAPERGVVLVGLLLVVVGAADVGEALHDQVPVRTGVALVGGPAEGFAEERTGLADVQPARDVPAVLGAGDERGVARDLGLVVAADRVQPAPA